LLQLHIILLAIHSIDRSSLCSFDHPNGSSVLNCDRSCRISSRNQRLARLFSPRGKLRMCSVVWLLFSLAILLLAVFAGRAHSRYLDELQSDSERQLVMGASFEKSVSIRAPRHRAWLQQAML